MEHRSGIRLKASIPVIVSDQEGHGYSGTTADLGRNGFFIHVPSAALRLDQCVWVDYADPKAGAFNSHYTRLTGRIVRIEDGGLAVTFDALSERQREALHRLRCSVARLGSPLARAPASGVETSRGCRR